MLIRSTVRPGRPVVRDLANSTKTEQTLDGPQDTLVSQDPLNPHELLDRVGKEAIRTGSSWGDSFGKNLGRAGGVATSLGALSVGVLGGALIAAVAQGGVGPTLELVSQVGAAEVLMQTVQSPGLIAGAGLAFGGVAGMAGAAGAWNVGKSLAGGVGKATGSALGYPVGLVTGVGKGVESLAQGERAESSTAPPEHTADRPVEKPMSGPEKVLATLVGGAGVAGGAVGGFALGASLLSTGDVVGLSTAAIAAGIAGGAAFATLGGLGGIQTAKGAKTLWDKTVNYFRGESLGQKTERMEALEQTLRSQRADLGTKVQEAHDQHKIRTAQLDQLQAENAQREQQAGEQLEKIDLVIETEAQALFRQQQPKPNWGFELLTR